MSTVVWTIADSISYWEPTTASEQNLVVAGGLKEVPVTSIKAGRFLGLCCGEVDDKGRSIAGGVAQTDAAPVPVDDGRDDGQPQSGAPVCP